MSEKVRDVKIDATVIADVTKEGPKLISWAIDGMNAVCPVTALAIKMKLNSYDGKGEKLQISVLNNFLRTLLLAYSGRTQEDVVYPIRALVADKSISDWKELYNVGIFPYFKKHNIINVKKGS